MTADFKHKYNDYVKINDSLSKMIIDSRKYGKFEILIDTESTNRLKERIWSIAKRDTVRTKFYAQSNKGELLHRYLLNPDKDEVIDHINRNTLDNRLANLRVCNSSVNNKNREGYGSCKYKYMSINKARKYHNMSYTIKFPSFKKRTFVDINEAKAYYIECMMDGGNINE